MDRTSVSRWDTCVKTDAEAFVVLSDCNRKRGDIDRGLFRGIGEGGFIMFSFRGNHSLRRGWCRGGDLDMERLREGIAGRGALRKARSRSDRGATAGPAELATFCVSAWSTSR